MSRRFPSPRPTWRRTTTGCNSNIKAELFINEFGQQEGMKVHAENDPAVAKALDLLPQAKQLADNAKKIIAAAQQRPPDGRPAGNGKGHQRHDESVVLLSL